MSSTRIRHRRRARSFNPTFPADIDCYMPANGETAAVTTNPSVPVDISLNLLKRETALGGAFRPPRERQEG